MAQPNEKVSFRGKLILLSAAVLAVLLIKHPEAAVKFSHIAAQCIWAFCRGCAQING